MQKSVRNDLLNKYKQNEAELQIIKERKQEIKRRLNKGIDTSTHSPLAAVKDSPTITPYTSSLDSRTHVPTTTSGHSPTQSKGQTESASITSTNIIPTYNQPQSLSPTFTQSGKLYATKHTPTETP